MGTVAGNINFELFIIGAGVAVSARLSELEVLNLILCVFTVGFNVPFIREGASNSARKAQR